MPARPIPGSARSQPSCVFCDIVRGRSPARIVRTFEDAVAFLPLTPATWGHVLVVPRRHVESPIDLDRSVAHALTDAVFAVTRSVSDTIAPAGINILQSTGAAATQTVAHLHVHVVPRNQSDGVPSPWPPKREWSDLDLDAMTHSLGGGGTP